MTLLEQLQAHKGGLLRLKTQLYWYGRGGWDNNPGRVCLLLDATCPATAATARATVATLSAFGSTANRTARAPTHATPTAAFLLIDGQPHWIWVAEEDIERL
jgi:hypothetical protein